MEPTTQLDLSKLNDSSSARQPFSLGNPDYILPCLLFLLTLAYLSIFVRYSSLEPDEGIVLEGAQRVLNGQVPYRDFFSFYTPGSFYLVASLWKVLGDSFAVARFSIALSGAFLPSLTYVLARRACTREIALLVASLVAIGGVEYRFLVLHNWYSTVFACLALYAALRVLETHRRVWSFATGSLCSFTAMFEQSKGAGVAAGLFFGFLTLRILGRKPLFRRSELAALGLGLLWPMALVCTYFAGQQSLAQMLNDWVWPLRHYTLANHVPYGYQNWSDHSRDLIFHTGPVWAIAVKALVVSPGLIVPILPLLAVLWYGYWAVQMWRSKGGADKCAYYILVSAASLGLLASIVCVRADVIHFMYLIPIWLVLLSWVLGGHNIAIPLLTRSRASLAFFFALSFGLMGLALLSTAAGAHNRVMTRRGTIRTRKEDNVIPYVQAHAVPGADILVYPYLPLYYYLTGTRSVAALDYFQPGMNTSAQAQEIVSALNSNPQSPVLFEPAFVQKFATSWPRTPLRAIANDPVADYLARNYRVCTVLYSPGDSWFEYMVRQDRPCQ